MSTEWITHRPPTIEDCAGVDRVPHSDHVWVMHEGKVTTCPFGHIVVGCPWRPIVVQRPEPYVKPKRFTAKWDAVYQRWSVVDKRYEYDIVTIRLPYLDGEHNDQHREAAEEIAAIYERTMP